MYGRMQYGKRVVGLTALVTLTVLAGCFSLSRTETPQRYYVLGGSVMQEDTAPPAGLAGVKIGVRRLRLASYLDPPYLAVRHGPHEIRYSEFHRWGEQLDAGINRAVAAYLTARAAFGRVDVAPWPARGSYDYLIQVRVERFEGALAEPAAVVGEVHMLATWEIVRQRDGSVLASGITDHREGEWTVGDHTGLVRALDTGLSVLSRDLVASLEELQASATAHR